MVTLKSLSIDEKLTLLTGKDCWQLEDLGKLPKIFLSDGPHGVRKMNGDETVKATAFPTLSALGSTWNPALAREMGELIAEEAIERDVDVVLAPGVNIKRTPLCGRNFEYFSEDPCLAGNLAYEYIEGVQSKGIGTSLKHFAANNREYDRLYQSSEVDERTLYEIYFPAFERALKAKPWTVMCSYNLVNGVFASENKKLLDTVLRKRLGFDGLIVSDWNAVVDRAKALKATLDLQMPHTDEAFKVLKSAYGSGYITEEEIDASVTRIFELIQKAEDNRVKRKITHTKKERHAAAVKIAEEAAVLLKNDGVLPLESGEKIYVGGRMAQTGMYGGGGSSAVESDYIAENLADLIHKENEKICTRYHEAYFCDDGVRHGFFNLRGAVQLAGDSDKAVIVVGFDNKTDCEGVDRISTKLSPVAVDFIKRIAAANPKTIVIVYGGSSVDMSEWIGCVSSVLYVNFNGEGGNEALARILTGKVSPSGKLQETFPLSYEENSRGNGYTETYTERMFVGYRGYDYRGEEVLFPFGYGLSYAKFEYCDLSLTKGKDNSVEVSFTLKNVSSTDGAEVYEAYVGARHSFVERPLRELKAFGKVFLKAGEKKKITFTLAARDFAYYSTALDGWRVEDGTYDVFVGGSSRDLPLKGSVALNEPYEKQPSQRCL